MQANIAYVETMEDWDALAAQLLAYAAGRRKFVLQGEIGAGKTTLVQAFAKKLGITEAVTSPTFSLVNEYRIELEKNQAPIAMYHLDLYRLNHLHEALDLDIETLLSNDAYCFIEWPELIEPLLTEDLIVIKILVEGDSRRKILFL
jgi:tRNA threonylcarbamoyladenosine biosynthesis protein TsaE